MTTQDRVQEHFNESLEYFKYPQIVGCWLQGSQNYGLETPASDVDTKLIVVPSFKDLAMNHQPVSTTHVRENNEHIDFKDVRLYMTTFRKQNLNFLEILFTPYQIVNGLYAQQWDRLVLNREKIAHMDMLRCVETMAGLAQRKYVMMEHRTPSKIAVINKYGYDPKELCHLMRIEDFCRRYINGEPFNDCLRPADPELLLDVKAGVIGIEQAREMARKSIGAMHSLLETAKRIYKNMSVDKEAVELLNDVQYRIMRLAMTIELKEED